MHFTQSIELNPFDTTRLFLYQLIKWEELNCTIIKKNYKEKHKSVTTTTKQGGIVVLSAFIVVYL